MALSVEELARFLTAAGGKPVSAAQVQAHLDAGAPMSSTGKINLVHYTAWLLREVQSSGD